MADPLPQHMISEQDLWAVFLGRQEPELHDFPQTQTQHYCPPPPQQQEEPNCQPQVFEYLHSTHVAQASSSHVPKEKKRKQKLPAVAFKTSSETTQLDDGFKWRKYGRKVLKCRKHPRNYYKCSESSGSAKKRVEIDPVDEGVVITSYEGTHNHESPSASAVYYISEPSLLPTPGAKPALMIVSQSF